MGLRQVKDRKQNIEVENDLRGLGVHVQERHPYYELIVGIENAERIHSIGKKHGMTLSEGKLKTPEKIPHHQQAIWHLFAALDLWRSHCISSAAITLRNPLSDLILNMKPHRNGKHDGLVRPDQHLAMDPSIIAFLLAAGFWKQHFQAIDIHPENETAGLHQLMTWDTFTELMQELEASQSQTSHKDLRNVG